MSIDCVRRLSVRNSANLREIYSRNFLFRALLPAARHCDDSEYAKFQLSTISRYLDEFGIAGILVRINKFDTETNEASADGCAVSLSAHSGSIPNPDFITQDTILGCRDGQVGSRFQSGANDDRGRHSENDSRCSQEPGSGLICLLRMNFCIPNKRSERFVLEYFAKNLHPSTDCALKGLCSIYPFHFILRG